MTTLTSSTEVLIGLGSNLDNPQQQVLEAIKAISALDSLSFLAASSLYESSPQGPQDQENFCNAVMLVSTNLLPSHLLSALQSIENNFGRIKTRHWGERIIDLDILFYGQTTVDTATPDLHIPHREALTRDFVIIPALEVAPHWRLPNGQPLKNYQDQCLNHQLTKIKF